MEPGLTQQQMLETIPNMYMFITYFTLIIGALGAIVGIVVGFPRAAVSAKRINEILDSVPKIQESENPVKPDENVRGTVEFRNVSFRYKPVDDDKKKKSWFVRWLTSDSKKKKKDKTEDTVQTVPDEEPDDNNVDKDAIYDINFVSRPGEITAIIGVTGCGKSTIVNLIPRLYDVSEGQILINGVDVRDLSFEDLHSRIAYVPQQSYLFSGTVKENIKFGNPDATDDEVWRAIEIAQAKAFVSSMADGIDSFVSQAGKNYSGGQKQRLAIARAIVKNAEIYIFDDSFSALDLATDARLRAALRANLPDANIIIVAQRVGTVINADRIIVMDEGKAVGIGTHEELLENCEVYKSIVASQLSDDEEEAAV
ncbi:MAG: ABC transporter ATP-binding protein [Clostridia bacterium]|nr:ABC transporter ATP-binding protein [Clostridia bacterium]